MRTKILIAVITVVAPLMSAVIVALITYQTNIRIGQLEHAAREQSMLIEQEKLREQQNVRRQQFMETNVPKLFGADAANRNVAWSLLLINYSDDAERVLRAVGLTSGDEISTFMQQAERQLQDVRRTTGEWVIVIGGHRLFADATTTVKAAKDAGFSPVAIYRRSGMYRVTVGSYATRDDAEQAVIAVRSKLRGDAYAISLGRWCGTVAPSTESGQEILTCSRGS